jgi:hypothetical protein
MGRNHWLDGFETHRPGPWRTTVYTRLSSQRDDLAKLSRYEGSIERSLRRALLDLERRQARRRAVDDAHRFWMLPARVERPHIVELGRAASNTFHVVIRQ